MCVNVTGLSESPVAETGTYTLEQVHTLACLRTKIDRENEIPYKKFGTE